MGRAKGQGRGQRSRSKVKVGVKGRGQGRVKGCQLQAVLNLPKFTKLEMTVSSLALSQISRNFVHSFCSQFRGVFKAKSILLC